MTMASGLYVVTVAGTMNASALDIDLSDNTYKVILVTDTHTPDFDTDNDYADVDNELATAGGYTQNSKTVGGSPTFALGSAGQAKYTWSTTVSWTSASFTARGMIITSEVSTGLLVCAVTFGQDYTATNGTFTITAHANGIFFLDLVP